MLWEGMGWVLIQCTGVYKLCTMYLLVKSVSKSFCVMFVFVKVEVEATESTGFRPPVHKIVWLLQDYHIIWRLCMNQCGYYMVITFFGDYRNF